MKTKRFRRGGGRIGDAFNYAHRTLKNTVARVHQNVGRLYHNYARKFYKQYFNRKPSNTEKKYQYSNTEKKDTTYHRRSSPTTPVALAPPTPVALAPTTPVALAPVVSAKKYPAHHSASTSTDYRHLSPDLRLQKALLNLR